MSSKEYSGEQPQPQGSRWLLHEDERVLCSKENKQLADYLEKQNEVAKTTKQVASHEAKVAEAWSSPDRFSQSIPETL